MSAFTRDEIVAQLVAKGIPRPMAERTADAEIARLRPAFDRGTGADSVTVHHWPTTTGEPCVVYEARFTHTVPVEDSTPVARQAIAWPVRLLLPWSLLVSDNERKEPYVVHVDGQAYARLRNTRKFTKAAEQIENIAKAKLGDADPYAGPLELTARVWLPGGSSRNDAINFAKGVHDALEGVVYKNDRWLHAVHWHRAGVDTDAPRAEITITPLLP